jgi:hypothetical protein
MRSPLQISSCSANDVDVSGVAPLLANEPVHAG